MERSFVAAEVRTRGRGGEAIESGEVSTGAQRKYGSLGRGCQGRGGINLNEMAVNPIMFHVYFKITPP
jgi:hypothetical protein